MAYFVVSNLLENIRNYCIASFSIFQHEKTEILIVFNFQIANFFRTMNRRPHFFLTTSNEQDPQNLYPAPGERVLVRGLKKLSTWFFILIVYTYFKEVLCLKFSCQLYPIAETWNITVQKYGGYRFLLGNQPGYSRNCCFNWSSFSQSH